MYKKNYNVYNFYEENMDNIINFNDYKTKRPLSDDDIKNLFLGLVNLIKNNAVESVNYKLKEEYKQNSIKLNNIKMELKLKDEIILDLKTENEKLSSKMKSLIKKIDELTKNNNIKKDI